MGSFWDKFMVEYTYMQKYKFLDVFQENPDGSLTPQKADFVNNISFGLGVIFQKE